MCLNSIKKENKNKVCLLQKDAIKFDQTKLPSGNTYSSIGFFAIK